MTSYALAAGLALLYAATLYCAFAIVSPDGRESSARGVAAATFAPSAVAWVMGLYCSVRPGASEREILLVLFALPVVILLSTRRFAPFASLIRTPRPDWPATTAFGALLVLIAYLALRVPAYSNDPLEYAAVAELIYRHRATSVYPVLDSAASGGLYAPWTHPPGFPMLIALMRLTGVESAEASLKAVSLIHLALGLGGLAALLPSRVRWIAVLSLAATPIYLIATVNGYVESVRVTTLIGLLAASVALRDARSPKAAVYLGVFFALCGYIHSLGIVTAPLMLVPLLLMRDGRWIDRIAWCGIALTCELLLLAPDLWRNLSLFGTLIGDRPEVWQLPEIGRASYFEEFRGLADPSSIVLRGLLQGFSQPANFGISYWLPLALLAVMGVGRRFAIEAAASEPEGRLTRHPALAVSFGFFATFYALIVVATLTGSVEAIKNPRYILTAQPFLAVMTAYLVAGLPWFERIRKPLLATLIASMLVPVLYFVERFPGLLTSTQSRLAAYHTYAYPEAKVITKIDELTAGKTCPLLFRQSDYAIYGRGCYRNFLDHRFSDVYKARSAAEAESRLRDQGIRFIVTPDYPMPEIYNTVVGVLLGDPTHSRLLWSEGGYAAYQVLDRSTALKVAKPVEVDPPPAYGPRYTLDWSRLSGTPQRSSGSVGVLCIETRGQGRVVARTLPAEETPSGGFLLRAVREPGEFVLGATSPLKQSLCVQRTPDQLKGKLQLETTRSARVTRLRFAWAQLQVSDPKGL